jgi:tetratricopeptide (TPR) repeat protein
VFTLKVAIISVVLLGQAGDREAAIAHVQRGNDAARAERWSDAIAAYTEAYRLFPSVGLCFNLAQAFDGAQRDAEALEQYRRYLQEAAQDPNADGRRDNRIQTSRGRVKALEERTPSPQVAPVEESDGSPPPPVTQVSAHETRSLALLPSSTQPDPRQAPMTPVNLAHEAPPSSGRWKWWAVAAGAAVIGVATVYLLSRDPCPEKLQGRCL